MSPLLKREGLIPPLNTRGRSCDQILGGNIANHNLIYSIKTLEKSFTDIFTALSAHINEGNGNNL